MKQSQPAPPPEAHRPVLVSSNPAIRFLFKLLALTCVGLGGLGVFLPLLPTTPFLLLAVFFSLRSSPSLYQWLVSHRVFGPPLQNYLDHRRISREVFWRAITLLWLSMALSIWLVKPVLLKGVLLVIAFSVTLYLARLTKKEKQ